MSSRATIDGTKRHAERHGAQDASPLAYRALGSLGLQASVIGFGCYRVDDEREEHQRALALALRSGCNLVDTSTNYMDGSSERAVGNVLAALATEGVLPRDEVIVVSKVGYVQGRNLERAVERERAGRPFPEMVKYADGCWHCIHPEFIADQVERSLRRLQLQAIDVYLLHNPEYFLSDAKRRGTRGGLDARRDEFYRRVKSAFACLEDQVVAGRIGAYGVSSNTLVEPADAPEATSLSRMLEVAREVAKERTGDPEAHHFAVAQLPLNLFEAGAALERREGPDRARTVLEEATREGVAILVNRPLNAFREGQLVRLADFPAREGHGSVKDEARRVIALEDEFSERIAPALAALPGGAAGADLFRWGRELIEKSDRFSDVLHWRQVESDMIRPRLEHTMAHVGLHLVGRVRNDWSDWKSRYLPALDALLSAIDEACRAPARDESQRITGRLDPLLPADWRSETLSRKALAVVAGTPGVTTVLCGMRRAEYVADALGVMKRPPMALDPEAYARFNSEGG